MRRKRHLLKDTSAGALFLMFWEIFRLTARPRFGLRKVQLFHEVKAQKAEHLSRLCLGSAKMSAPQYKAVQMAGCPCPWTSLFRLLPFHHGSDK